MRSQSQLRNDKIIMMQTIDVSRDDPFPVRFLNICVNYPLGQMRNAPFRLWQIQLNFVVFCALSACWVSSEHLNYKKHPMMKSLYQFHMYYHVEASSEIIAGSAALRVGIQCCQ